jgi:predicted mannosyl-3-phosphoglycerate phosphatase (HAD superfamily)
MFAWIRADEISGNAAAILGRVGWFEADSWGRAVQTKIKTITGLTASIRRVIENLAGVFGLGMVVDSASARARAEAVQFA